MKSEFRRTMTSPHGPYGVGYRRATRMFTIWRHLEKRS